MGYLFVNVLWLAGTGAGWLAPFFGLMVYYAFAILRPLDLWFWNRGSWFTERLSLYVAVSTLVGWAIASFGDWSDFKHVRVPMYGLLVYLLCGILGTALFAVNKQVAWNALELQLKIGLMAFVTVSLVRSPKHIRAFAWVLLLTLGYLAYNFNMEYLKSPGYAWVLTERGFGGVDNNGVAMIMVCGVPLAFFMAIDALRYKGLRRWGTIGLCMFISMALIHVILFSYSRGGQLGLALVGAALFVYALVFLPHKFVTIGLGVVMLAGTIRLAGAEVTEEFWSIFADPEARDASAASRFDTWAGGFQAIMENPQGLGPRNFNLVSHQYGLPFNKSIHNLFLQVGADYGIVGMLGLMTFYIGSMWISFRTAISGTARQLGWASNIGYMVSLSLMGLLVCSIFIGMEAVEVGYLIALLGLCMSMCVRRIAAEEYAGSSRVPELEQVPDRDQAFELMPGYVQ